MKGARRLCPGRARRPDPQRGREYTFAPIFGSDVYCRFRHDTLQNGLDDNPDYDTPDARRHLAYWQSLLADAPGEVRKFMPRDSLMIIDHHRALHARSAFEDPRRLVIRIRYHAAAGRLETLRPRRRWGKNWWSVIEPPSSHRSGTSANLKPAMSPAAIYQPELRSE